MSPTPRLPEDRDLLEHYVCPCGWERFVPLGTAVYAVDNTLGHTHVVRSPGGL